MTFLIFLVFLILFQSLAPVLLLIALIYIVVKMAGIASESKEASGKGYNLDGEEVDVKIWKEKKKKWW